MADANFVIKNGLVANGTFRANSTVVNAAAITATGLTIGAVTVNATTVNVGTATINSTNFSGTANNALFLNGVSPSNLVNTSGVYTISGAHTYSANVVVGTGANTISLFPSNGALFVYAGSTANSTTIIDGTDITIGNATSTFFANAITTRLGNSTVNVSTNTTGFFVSGVEKYINATNITTGTLNYARLPSGLVNTSSDFTYSGTQTYLANTTLSAAAIYMAFNESDWGTRWIHMNGGVIGFLTTNAGAWACYSDNSGNFTAAGNISAYSDMRLKVNIHPLTGALEIVKSINGVSYEWKDSGKKGIGVIAQEMQAVLPELVMEGNDGTLSVAYGNLTAVLIEAIKELSARVEELEKRI